MDVASKIGIVFTIAIVIAAASFAANGGSLTATDIGQAPKVMQNTIEQTKEKAPQLLAESAKTVQETIPEVPEPVEEALDEVEETVPDPATVVEQGEGEHIELVEIPEGTSVRGCEDTNSCYIPYVAKLSGNGEVIWTNLDNVAHTVTSGTPSHVTDFFNSGLIMPDQTYSKSFGFVEGEIDYFCLVHPWQQGKIVIE